MLEKAEMHGEGCLLVKEHNGTDGERYYVHVSWSKDRWCGMYYVGKISDGESCIEK